MDTKKRRVIYMTDEEWADVEQWAQFTGRSISAAIRDAMESTMGQRATVTPSAGPNVRSFNARPFTPVPKKGK